MRLRFFFHFQLNHKKRNRQIKKATQKSRRLFSVARTRTDFFDSAKLAKRVINVCVFQKFKIFSMFFVHTHFARTCASAKHFEKSPLSLRNFVIAHKHFVRAAKNVKVNDDSAFYNAHRPVQFFAIVARRNRSAAVRFLCSVQNAAFSKKELTRFERKNSAQFSRRKFSFEGKRRRAKRFA